jgi:peptidoglycan hydrolase-like protein with peptidoglycan-binding domain
MECWVSVPGRCNDHPRGVAWAGSRLATGGEPSGSLKLSQQDIRQVQQVLEKKGYKAGNSSSALDDKTKEAIRSFQKLILCLSPDRSTTGPLKSSVLSCTIALMRRTAAQRVNDRASPAFNSRKTRIISLGVATRVGCHAFPLSPSACRRIPNCLS